MIRKQFLRTVARGLLAALPAAFAASCSAPRAGSSAGAVSVGRDYWGHRPGPRGFRTVVLDAGHGGHDSGARSRWTGQAEKEAALDWARRVKAALEPDFRVVLVRSGDEFVDLDDRVRFANRYGDAVLVSLHFNSGPARLSGPETFYWRVDSHSLAKRVQRKLEAASPFGSGNRGLVRRRLRLTRNPEIPCVLVEGGYLSHPLESRKIADPGYREKLARAVAGAIREQAALGDAGMGPPPRPIYAPVSRPTDPRE